MLSAFQKLGIIASVRNIDNYLSKLWLSFGYNIPNQHFRLLVDLSSFKTFRSASWAVSDSSPGFQLKIVHEDHIMVNSCMLA